MSEKTILVWFRNDLRVHDNEILFEATRKVDKILPVYCFDPFYFKTTEFGLPKTGSIRARFLLESVIDLRNNLQQLGGELIVRIGNPVDIIPQLALQYQVSEVYHHREVAFEETNISEQVEAALWKIKLNLKHFIGHTLYHKEDLPFPIKDIPDSFSVFKKKVERDSQVRPCIETPQHIATPAIIDAGTMPTLADLGIVEPVDSSMNDFVYKGGETMGLKHLEEYLQSPCHHTTAKHSKHNTNCPSKLSAWLSLGCVSMRCTYHQISNCFKDTPNAPLMLELLWRDYFRFMFKKHGKSFFTPVDVESSSPKGDFFVKWESGSTGVPYIDACMHQLNAIGYISNYNRQIVANFLINQSKEDWLKGAAYFEAKLIDYSPASNWGNWAFLAGINNNQKDTRYFSGLKQIEELETESDFIKAWLS